MIQLNQENQENIKNSPVDILSAWSAMEVLLPQKFKQPSELKKKQHQRLIEFDEGNFPWLFDEEDEDKPRYCYHIVLGSIDFDMACEWLIKIYGDSYARIKNSSNEKAVLASITVDERGVPVGERGIYVSSFGWGLVQALNQNLSRLHEWTGAEACLVRELMLIIGVFVGVRAITREDIDEIYKQFVASLGLPEELVKKPSFMIRERIFKDEKPLMPFLNSFFLKDLSYAKSLFYNHSATENLRRYLGDLGPDYQKDLLTDDAAIEEALAPRHFSLGRWPNKGRHSLVFLQQAAVNLINNELKESGIFSVNGPPGTGKTTLIRDIVADKIVQRAQALAKFENPVDAFVDSGECFRKSDGSTASIYKLDPSLCGFEMLVASSNNNAAENISVELPGISSVTEELPELRYFKSLSDKLLEKKTWGAIAVPLGKLEKCRNFKKIFWEDVKVGLNAYLSVALGDKKLFCDDEQIELEELPPVSKFEAMRQWYLAKRDFVEAIKKSEENLLKYESARKVSLDAFQKHKALQSQLDYCHNLEHEVACNEEDIEVLERTFNDKKNDLLHATNNLRVYKKEKPKFFHRLLRAPDYKQWNICNQLLEVERDESHQEFKDYKKILSEKKKRYAEIKQETKKAYEDYNKAKYNFNISENQLNGLKNKIKGVFVDTTLFASADKEKQTCTPWLDQMSQQDRDIVFEKAIALHKAFIYVVAKPLRDNLSVLMDVLLSSAELESLQKTSLLDLWRTLFLVIPVVSTTFSSVNRMIGDLPPESLGWLLVDEAGQALPQSAIGAIIRTKRAVILGDPFQIEPIITLPESVTQSICLRYHVSPHLFNPPGSSVQVLADKATSYIAQFNTKNGVRQTGAPLLVHRRCSEPMFSFSNAIAYGNLMVNVKDKREVSLIREAVGESQWFHVEDIVEDKWSLKEGEKVLEILQDIVRNNDLPDLLIISPFTEVQNQLRDMIIRSKVLSLDTRTWLSKRVGTIHIAQGKEVEGVILVLGAPSSSQKGSRYWAGKVPNLLNVAISRAKDVFYVVGNQDLWREAGFFAELDQYLTDYNQVNKKLALI